MNDLKQLLKDVTYTVITGTDEIRVTDLVIDSRKAKEGCAFFCFIGANSDGHDYVKDVIQKGAAVIIIQKDPFTFWWTCSIRYLKNDRGSR